MNLDTFFTKMPVNSDAFVSKIEATLRPSESNDSQELILLDAVFTAQASRTISPISPTPTSLTAIRYLCL